MIFNLTGGASSTSSGSGNNDELLAEFLLAAHPIGSYYWSSDDRSPAELFGGTWEQVKDQFILAAGDSYAAGDTGGAAEHTLTEEELPNVTGKFILRRYGPTATAFTALNFGGHFKYAEVSGFNQKSVQTGDGNNQTGQEITYAFGSDQPHNNMPPYTVAYCWRRIPDSVIEDEEEEEAEDGSL